MSVAIALYIKRFKHKLPQIPRPEAEFCNFTHLTNFDFRRKNCTFDFD